MLARSANTKVESADQVRFALGPLGREKAGISSQRIRAASGSTSPGNVSV